MTGAAAPPIRRLESIQVLRGIAAVLVVTTHACNIVFSNEASTGRFVIGSFGQFQGFGAVGVDLFFIISGFVMAFSVAGRPAGAAGARRFLVLRWIRIAPPYLLVTAALIAHLLILGRTLDWRSVANALLFVPVVDTSGYTTPPLSIGWTLSFEFSFYLLIALAVLVRQARRTWLVAALLVVLVAVGVPAGHTVFLLGWFSNPILLEFALGILAYRLWAQGLLARLRWMWGLAGLAGAGYLVLRMVTGFGGIADMFHTLDASLSMERFLVWGVPCFFVFTACVSVWRSVGDGPVGRVLTAVGDSSYSLYLVHLPVLLLAARIPVHLGWRLDADVFFGLLVVGGVIAGYLYYRAFERPVTRMLRRSVERRRVPRAGVSA